LEITDFDLQSLGQDDRPAQPARDTDEHCRHPQAHSFARTNGLQQTDSSSGNYLKGLEGGRASKKILTSRVRKRGSGVITPAKVPPSVDGASWTVRRMIHSGTAKARGDGLKPLILKLGVVVTRDRAHT
jgi:hypothetical protein